MTEDRIINIETKLTHQEDTLEQLSQVLYDQQKTIDRLEILVTKLTQKLIEAIGEGDSEIRGNEKPPHY